jgi:type I restriction enzyme S subunit
MELKFKKLGEIVSIKTGKLNANAAVEGGSYPFFTCSRQVFEIDEFAFDCEAILLAGNNAVGDFNVKHYSGKFNAYQRTYVITINNENEILYPFLYLQMKLALQKLKEQSVGAGTKFLKIGMINALPIVLLDLLEQKQIVAKLDQAFADIEKAKVNAEQNLKSSRELFESYLEKAFSQKSEGWVERELFDICNFKHGFAFKSEFFVPISDYILLTPGNFYEEGGYRDRGSKQKYYQGDFPAEYLLSKGDLLIAMTEQAKGLLGSPILVPDSGQFLHNQRLGLVELSSAFDEKIHLPFMYHFFNTKYFRSKVQETATGLKVRHTSPKKMAVISLSFPCELDVQVLIAEKLDKVKKESLKLESIYTQKIKVLDELKQSILQKAFNGELA